MPLCILVRRIAISVIFAAITLPAFADPLDFTGPGTPVIHEFNLFGRFSTDFVQKAREAQPRLRDMCLGSLRNQNSTEKYYVYLILKTEGLCDPNQNLNSDFRSKITLQNGDSAIRLEILSNFSIAFQGLNIGNVNSVGSVYSVKSLCDGDYSKVCRIDLLDLKNPKICILNHPAVLRGDDQGACPPA